MSTSGPSMFCILAFLSEAGTGIAEFLNVLQISINMYWAIIMQCKPHFICTVITRVDLQFSGSDLFAMFPFCQKGIFCLNCRSSLVSFSLPCLKLVVVMIKKQIDNSDNDDAKSSFFGAGHVATITPSRDKHCT